MKKCPKCKTTLSERYRDGIYPNELRGLTLRCSSCGYEKILSEE